MEETVQVLLDEGALVRDGGGEADQVARRAEDSADGAGDSRRAHRPPARRCEGAAADAGRDRASEFPLSLVRAVVTKSEDELNRMLNDLQLGEFIYEQPAVGDTEYIFKHALTQEVAYNSVLMERRKHLHERTARRDRDALRDLGRRPSRPSSRIITDRSANPGQGGAVSDAAPAKQALNALRPSPRRKRNCNMVSSGLRN